MSLVLHGFFILKKYDFKLTSTNTSKEVKKVRLVLKDRNETNKVDDKKINQIAQTNESQEDVKVESSYFSEKNNTFKKQTKAQEVGSFNNAGKGNAKIDQVAQASAEKASQNKQQKNKKKKGDISLADFSFADIKKDALTKDKREVVKMQELVSGIENGSKNSRGISKTNDFLEQVPLGDMTNLNTTEHVYYGFYFRIKQQLEQYWGASIQEKMEAVYKKNNGRFPASDKYITSIRVTLDDKGKIIDIKVKGSSGVQELDQAAVESFNRAGPFPNPPKGMIQNGKASIEWGFAVTNS